MDIFLLVANFSSWKGLTFLLVKFPNLKYREILTLSWLWWRHTAVRWLRGSHLVLQKSDLRGWSGGSVVKSTRTALPEDQSSIPSTHIKWLRTIISLTPGEFNSSGLHGNPHVGTCVHTHTHLKIIKKIKRLELGSPLRALLVLWHYCVSRSCLGKIQASDLFVYLLCPERRPGSTLPVLFLFSLVKMSS